VIPRFFVPHAETTGSTIELPADEALHLVRVLRSRAGDAVRVFDGRGGEWLAVVERTTKTHAWVRLVEPASPALEPGIHLTLAVAILKGDKTDDVIRDAVMLGVAAVQPLLTERTEVPGPIVTRGRRRERWQQIAIASAKQCGRAVVPEVRPPVALEAALAASVSGMRIALVEPAAAGAGLATVRDRPRPEQAEVVIGPEGGWSPREIAALAGTSMLLTLGRQTLRADAAPIVALAALRAAWDDF
jgi:16S rRNA (uracil1498-N3)-methyltransferase